MEYSPRIPEVENVLGKIGKNLYSENKDQAHNPTDMMQVSFQIQQNIGILVDLSNKEKFHQIKLALASNVLRTYEKQKINVQIKIPSTVFGDIYETLSWNFAIEGIHTDFPQLEAYADNMMHEWQEKNQYVQEDTPAFVRMSNLLQNGSAVGQIFESIDSQLNQEDKTGAIFLTSMALFDLEKLSSSRQKDMLLYQDLYNEENALDKWLACLDIHAQYQKPTFNMSSYLIH